MMSEQAREVLAPAGAVNSGSARTHARAHAAAALLLLSFSQVAGSAPASASAAVQAADTAALAVSLTDLGGALLRPSSAANAVVSPVATAVALGLVQAGASGPAEQEIEALFGPRPQGGRALRQGLPALLRQLQGEPGTASPLALAARMWVDGQASVPKPYVQRLAGRWQADAQRVSFAQSEAARVQINRWTAERTAGRIQDLLPAGSISSATQMALTSAVHFRSPWEKPFDAAQTVARPFKTAAGASKAVPTMVDERAVLQTRVDGHLVMEIPFAPLGGGQPGFALLVAVPEEGAAAPASPALTSGSQLVRWRSVLAPIKCELSLPRFAVAPVSGSLKSALQALGVKTVFTDRADLRPMLGRGAHQMHLDDVHQAAGITVDEQGGEAVAAAAATVRSKSFALPVPACAVDRAFTFALVHRASGTPLFVGRVGDPTLSP